LNQLNFGLFRAGETAMSRDLGALISFLSFVVVFGSNQHQRQDFQFSNSPDYPIFSS